MEFDDYESLPEAQSVGVHMTAGALAGIMEHCVMFPIDTVKTRMQSLSAESYQTIRGGMMKMVSTEGLSRPVWGMSAVIIGAGPAHALYFSAYEAIKRAGSHGQKKGTLQTTLTNAAAGCGATLLHDSVMVPADVIKQRMQMFNCKYRSCFNCIYKLYSNEGIRPFYRSFSTQLAMNLPFHAIHIVTYEKMHEIFNPNREYNPSVHMAGGAIAGSVAAVATNPLDMCKTVLNTQEASALHQMNLHRITGITGAVKSVYHVYGLLGFFRGLQARVLYQMPATAISWSVYELFKHSFSESERQKENPIPSPHGELLKDNVISKESVISSNCDSSSGGGLPCSVRAVGAQFSDSSHVIPKTVERLRHNLQIPVPSVAAEEHHILGK